MMIKRENVRDIIALTPVQQGILYQYIKQADNTFYFQRLCMDLQASLSVDEFKKVVQQLLDDNLHLKCVYRWKNISNPICILLRECPVEITFWDISGKPSGEMENK